ncbi:MULTISPECIES: UbiA family prenyltransferase [Archaeoglobus]|uniref:Uncharacterized protein AF_0771 n=2 Tax=Archaeoglobus fulgidus TaxID=2234 RepID=Y771_ARCFU|nr:MULTISPECIES: UbiA family prenyltransferase [Archaeoglobus]O29487.1 RecName: Full=Uncharacterized protein AF_0771 [Archaeoglobus fulgidus DSM 4304]AAB90477.1 predicted coding region AF_0771 [Archaeoglobus fulgidus DSM 4304]AIG97647.1 1,4-dihydroxy-2-naphthoate octaprenyltransferase [Archaeoglobus fulgidus DSM 8774]MDI3496872.1 hypothetical protein [Archaeoglobus sp.]
MIFEIIKIGSQPINFAYPIPLLSLLAFMLSGSGYNELIISYIFAFSFFTAANLWNHLNDAEDDLNAGRNYARFLIEHRKIVTEFVVAFYFVSFLLIFFISKSKEIALLLTGLSVVLTWLYSDKIFIGKIIRRFKEDYKTEVFTYILCSFSFPLSFWTIFSEISQVGVVFTLATGFTYLSGFFLKDLKDISADIKSGYRTLAVVLSPSTLLIISVMLFIASTFVVIFSSLLDVTPTSSLLVLTVYPPILFAIYKFHKEKWKITKNIISSLKIYTYSYLGFLIAFAIGCKL